MKEKIIQRYVDMLTKEDIVKFASTQNEILTNNEVDFSVDKWNKIENLILEYKEKYKSFL